MKTRIVSELPEEKLGQSELRGKILTSLEDNVGFTVSHVSFVEGDKGRLVPLYDGHNHIYYCIQGKCFITLDGQTALTLTNNSLLALSSATKAQFVVQEPTRLGIVSVPGIPNVEPSPFFLSLESILGTDRDVDFSRGHSRRFLREADGFNITVANTMPHANYVFPMQYKNHIEANIFFKGRGTYSWNNGADSLEFDEMNPAKSEGIMYLLDNHDAHTLVVAKEKSQLICVFFPALKGDEVHKFDDKSQLSSY